MRLEYLVASNIAKFCSHQKDPFLAWTGGMEMWDIGRFPSDHLLPGLLCLDVVLCTEL